MTTRLSTGLVNKLLDTGSLKSIFAASFIDIYSGPQPAAADAAATGTLLCTIYSDGTSAGLNLASAAVAGVIAKATGETWSGTVLANGTAGYFRLRAAADAGTSVSTTAARIDGAIATSGAELNLGSVVFNAGAPFIMASAQFTLPMSA